MRRREAKSSCILMSSSQPPRPKTQSADSPNREKTQGGRRCLGMPDPDEIDASHSIEEEGRRTGDHGPCLEGGVKLAFAHQGESESRERHGRRSRKESSEALRSQHIRDGSEDRHDQAAEEK